FALLGKSFNDEQLLRGMRLALHEFGDDRGAAVNFISIIDDDESIRRATSRLIESFGFRAGAFESAERFLSSGHLNDTSCLIVDVNARVMCRLQLQSQVAAAGSTITSIFISARDNKEDGRIEMHTGTITVLTR